MPTRREVLKAIEKCEEQGIYDEHVDTIDFSLALNVDENYKYYKKGFLAETKEALERFFVVNPFTAKLNRRQFKTKVFGKENLKGLKSGIVTCNHVNMFDCLVAKWAFRGKKMRITAAPFNNRKDRLGALMRSGGMIPMGSSFAAMKNFNRAVEYFIKNNTFIMFYPEQAMWWSYEKPRPYKNGAFSYAAKLNVPVIPCFITFTNQSSTDEEGLPLKQFNFHIMPPIFPDSQLKVKENVQRLKQEAYNACAAKYEEFYKRPLVHCVQRGEE